MKRTRVVVETIDSNMGVKARIGFFFKDNDTWMLEISLKQAEERVRNLLAENQAKRLQKKKMPHSRAWIHAQMLEYRWLRLQVYRGSKQAVAAA